MAEVSQWGGWGFFSPICTAAACVAILIVICCCFTLCSGGWI
ncbi:MAG: hypothetical protein QHH02_04475 [Syntrophomonadaceae bacterium]|nr:hypothetical protein [Syntrophomonadaceae bacterium]